MQTLMADYTTQYPDTVRIFDVRRPSVWVMFTVTWQGVRFVQASCDAGHNMRESAQLLAALAV